MSPVQDKTGKPIHEGEIVSGKIRGGRHVGEVQEIKEGVKNGPKVVIKDQHGHIVNRNPASLEHGDVGKK